MEAKRKPFRISLTSEVLKAIFGEDYMKRFLKNLIGACLSAFIICQPLAFGEELPTGNQKEPAASSQQLATNDRQPETVNRKPSTGNRQPETVNRKPSTEFEEPDVRVLIVPLVETVLSGEIPARIERIRVDIGDRFKSGRNLVVFDCETYKAQLEKAKVELTEARKIFEINKRLDALQSVSEIEMAASAAKMEMAKAEMSLRKTQIKKCTVKAPFSGRVVRRKANPFEYVSPGQPLLEVIDDVHLRLQLLVPSRWSKWMKKKLRFKVHIDETGKDYTARITALGARVDPVSQTLEVRAKIDGKHRELLAGMSGTAHFDIPKD